MSADLASPQNPRPHRGRVKIRAEIAAFIAELAHAGIRPAEHFQPGMPGRAQSITLVGWSLEGCRGQRRGCGPECVTVVTTNGRIAVMSRQPGHTRWRRARPAYLDLPDGQNLQPLLATGRAILLPRQESA